MRVKAADIARALGISKATVSLALNGKPGVKESTRKSIFDYKERMELAGRESAEGLRQLPFDLPADIPHASVSTNLKQVKILSVSNGMKNILNSEMDLWTDVKTVFEKLLRQAGYHTGLTYVDFRTDDAESILADCNAEFIDGIILMGTELVPESRGIIERINKPLVVYDYCPVTSDRHSCVMIDNRQGIELAVNELWEKGNRDIVYLGMSLPMYNYQSRRRGFHDSLVNRGITGEDEIRARIVETDCTINGVYEFMRIYLEEHPLPQAFIMDSYHVSIGTVRALLEKGVKIPEDISLIGVDKIPEFMTGGISLTSVRVPHTERAYWTVQLILKEMTNPVREKIRIYTNCELEEGSTVAKR